MPDGKIKGLAEANIALVEKTDSRYNALVAQKEADSELPESAGERTPSLDAETPDFNRRRDMVKDEPTKPAPEKKAAKK